MSGFAERSGIDTLADAFDWAAVSTVVDVGGGRGEVSISLAERFTHLDFIVQDLKHVVSDCASLNGDSEHLRRRVKFVEHDYFAPQKTVHADVYYFRYIFHNLPDDSCVELLKAQIPGRNYPSGRCIFPRLTGLIAALKPGAHILIQDAVVPEPRVDLSAYKEKYRR